MKRDHCSASQDLRHTLNSPFALPFVWPPKSPLFYYSAGLHASAADKRTIPLCSGFQARRLCARLALRVADAGIWRGPARCDEDSQSRQTAAGSDSDRLLAPGAKVGEVKDLWGWRPGDQGSRGHRGGDIWPALTSLLLFLWRLVEKTNMFNCDLWAAHDMTSVLGHPFVWLEIYDRNHFFF